MRAARDTAVLGPTVGVCVHAQRISGSVCFNIPSW